MPTPDSTVIILSRQPGEWLAAALASVLDQAGEVVVVDNGSAGATASAIARRHGAIAVRAERNLGFAGGVNLGVRHARSDVIALLNDDAVAPPGWLAAARRDLAAPEVAAVVPKVLLSGWYRVLQLDDAPWYAPGDGRPLGRRLSSVVVDGVDVLARLRGPGVHRLEAAPGSDPARWRWTAPPHPCYVPVPDPAAEVLVDGEVVTGGPTLRLLNKAGSMLRRDGALCDIGDGEPDGAHWGGAGERFYASGTALATRADVLAGVGGLAEPFFAYYEDVDWSWRARLAGLRIVYDPDVVVEHRHGATSGGPAASWVRTLGPRNHLLSLARNAPAAPAVAATRRRLAEPDGPALRRPYLRRLPWALATRRELARRWELSPGEVWDRWAGSVDGG